LADFKYFCELPKLFAAVWAKGIFAQEFFCRLFKVRGKAGVGEFPRNRGIGIAD